MNTRRYKKMYVPTRVWQGGDACNSIIKDRGFTITDYYNNRSVIIVLITLTVLLTFHKLILSVCQH